jgi:hypothetical protein
MTEANRGFGLIIKTNSYTGNFERDICAYLTGVVGECEVGDEFVNVLPNKPDFESNIMQVPDDHGCHRPVSIANTSNKDLVIFFETKPTLEQIDFIKQYASTFDHARRTIGRMAQFHVNAPKIEILGFALESYNRSVEQLPM